MLNVTLANGVRMPILGYGVYQIPEGECERCVLDALDVGYRMIDTAQVYLNEAEVGNAIYRSSIPRKELFLTSKVWVENHDYKKCRASVEESCAKLKTDYIDLILIHQPVGDYYSAWRALEDLYEIGMIRAIGISNFAPERMVDIASFTRIKPMVNQIETHPFNQQKAAALWAKKYGIQLEAWAPFGEGVGGMFDLPVLKEIGLKYGKKPSQVILRWHVQRGFVAIPKTVSKDRMSENFQIFDFELSDEDMNVIASLDKGKSAFFSHQDPNVIERFAATKIG